MMRRAQRQQQHHFHHVLLLRILILACGVWYNSNSGSHFSSSLLVQAQTQPQNIEPFVLTKELLEIFMVSSLLESNASAWEILANLQSDAPDGQFPIDGALVVRAEGRCYGRFRGMLGFNSIERMKNGGMQDAYQQYKPGTKDACTPNSTTLPSAPATSICCPIRTGIQEAYYATYKDEFERILRDCAATTCATDRPDDCVVLTGMSQGAMIAQVAAIALSDLNPKLVVFGPEQTLYPDCPAVNPSRFYRLVNTGLCKMGFVNNYIYDFPWFEASRGEMFYGYMLILSDDTTAVANIGLNAQDWDLPFPWRILGINAHTLRSGAYWYSQFCVIDGYVDRLRKLKAAYEDPNRTPRLSYPVRSTGFVSGTYCTKDGECQSRLCKGYRPLLFKPGKCK